MFRYLFFIFLILFFITVLSAESSASTFDLHPITKMWQTAKTMHPAWEKLYPICIASGDDFYLYQPSSNGTWTLTKTENRSGQVPKEIRAAYPVDFADNQIVCVIDPSVLANQKQIITVFHEFVHCYQFNTCEFSIKDSLQVNQDAMAQKNWMWELNYPFPYDNIKVTKTYLTMIAAAKQGKVKQVGILRGKLRSLLTKQEWEYLSWQEFKEGTARYLQNELNAKYGYPRATSSHQKPLNRVIFYEGGDYMIRMLLKSNPDMINDLPALWIALYTK